MESAPISRPRPSTSSFVGCGRPHEWCDGLPTLHASSCVLREIDTGDAQSLLTAISTERVARFISPPPQNTADCGCFIVHARAQRRRGSLVCFAVTPSAENRAIGIFQVRALTPSFDHAEWGFALAAEFWGTQVFGEAARAVIEFSFTALGVRRLEARVAVANGRGNGALRKLGAVREGLLRSAFLKNGVYVDQALWTILAGEWNPPRVLSSAPAH